MKNHLFVRPVRTLLRGALSAVSGHVFSLIIVCLMLCTCLPPMAVAKPHRIVNMGSREGLRDLLVNCIHEDDAGVIWLGTGSTVECFDGVRFRHFPIEGKAGPQKRVTAITGSPARGLWAGNGDGLWMFDSHTEQFVPQYEADIAGGVTSVLLDSTGVLYVATTVCLYVVEDGQVRPYRLQPASGLPAGGIEAMCMDESGTLWMTSTTGLYALTADRQMVQQSSYLPDGGYTSIAVGGGTVWLGTFHSGIYAWDIASGTLRQASNIPVPIQALQVCSDRRLLVGTDGVGVLLYDTDDFALIERWSQQEAGPNRLTSNSVYSLLQDRREVLWVGLYQNGVDYTLWQGDRVGVHHTPLFNSEGVAVRALCIHGEQRLIGTRQGLYFIDKADRRFRAYGEEELNSQMVFALSLYEGEYYIGTYGGGLHRLDPRTPEVRPASLPEAIGGQVFTLATDGEGRLWAGTERGVWCLTGKDGRLRVEESYTSRTSQLPEGRVYHIFFDRMGRGWLCTAGGVALYDPASRAVSTYNFPQTFPARAVVRQIWQSEEGVLYFVPEKGDLFAYDEQWRPRPVPDTEGVDALFITDDGRGNLLIGTSNGLWYCHPDGTSERLDFSDGLPSPTFTHCQPQTDDEGTVWLGNSRGLVWIKPDSICLYSPQRPHALHISRILADNTPIKDGIRAVEERMLRLPRGTSNLTVLLSDMSFTDPACMKCECLLEGMDEDWQCLTGVSEHTWHNLRSGTYRLRLRYPGEPEGEYAMTVRVPMTNEMLLLLTVVLLSVVVGTGVCLEIRRRNIRRKQEMLRRQQEEEARNEAEQKYKTTNIPVAELRKLRKEVDALMEEERLYLNPELKLSDIANRLNTSSYMLSFLFSQHMKTSFYDYINQYRVESFKQRVRNGETGRYTLDALATRCGYNSRATFFRNFKKVTGMTPTEYIASKGG